ncbi:MAG: RecQ family ATP-dependent DNA helicase, partial [Muribaculaceae bacterium]|nr:RecQ family ATP-dependent DNA helicase [Muribaculaceae bacterium]
MSFWNRIVGSIYGSDAGQNQSQRDPADSKRYCFVDVEVGAHDKKIHDIGAISWRGGVYHGADRGELMKFIKGADYVCGHNIINHDAKYLFGDQAAKEGSAKEGLCKFILVDTLPVSPLLFSERPYHRLVKDDKLLCDQMNNPVNDCEKARTLLMDEVGRWEELSTSKKLIFATLLRGQEEFCGFLSFVNSEVATADALPDLIRSEYLY